MNKYTVFLFLTCNSNNKVDDKKQITEINYVKKDTILSFDGIWAENEEDNAWFIIKGDSIQNVEHDNKMCFKISGDTLVIYYVDFIGTSIILKHTKDSLIFRNEDNSISKLYNRDEK